MPLQSEKKGSKSSVTQRLSTLRELLGKGVLHTQEELRSALDRSGHKVNQSTISRDLRRVGAIKTVDRSGRTVYRTGEETPTQGLGELIESIVHNGSLIVIHTTQSSAPLVALHLDKQRPEGVLGTVAGDDTIFVAPSSVKTIDRTLRTIRKEFGLRA